MASPIRLLSTARVLRSSTRVLEPVPSARTQPVTVTWPDGGSGIVAAVGALVVGLQAAAVDQQRRAVGGDQGHHDVDAGAVVGAAVADDHGLVDVVGAGGRDQAPLVVLRDRSARGEHVGDGGGVAGLVGADDGVARPCAR